MIKTYDFELIKAQEIPEINSKISLFRHKVTGAELLSVENDDENKVFGISFKTTPSDSTGVAHILEHAVLNGSEKYRLPPPTNKPRKPNSARIKRIDPISKKDILSR